MKFPCLRYSKEGSCPSLKCSIREFGFCSLFGKILEREVVFLRKKYYFLNNEQKLEDYLTDVYLNVEKSLLQLRIKNERGFVKFVKRIFHNKAVDHLKKHKREEKEEPFSSLIDEETEDEYSIEEYITAKYIAGSNNLGSEEEIYERAEKVLEEIRSLDHPCGELILYWYEKQEEGWSQKQMAENLGLKPNTFNQKLRRCFKYIRERLSAQGGGH